MMQVFIKIFQMCFEGIHISVYMFNVIMSMFQFTFYMYNKFFQISQINHLCICAGIPKLLNSLAVCSTAGSCLLIIGS